MRVSHCNLNQYEEAITCFDRTLSVFHPYGRYGPRGPVTTVSEFMKRALTVEEKAYGHYNPRLLTTLNELGRCHRDIKQHEKAIKCFERALTVEEKAYAHDDLRLVSTVKEVGRYHRDLGQYQEATKCFDRALSILEKTYGHDELLLGSKHEEANPTVIASASGPGDVPRPSDGKTRFFGLPRLMLHV